MNDTSVPHRRGSVSVPAGSIGDADGISAEVEAAVAEVTAAAVRLLAALRRERQEALPRPTQRGASDETERVAYRVPEAAKLLGVSASLLAEQIRAGRIPTFQIGTRVLVSRSELERLAAGADAESRRVVELMADRRRKRQ